MPVRRNSLIATLMRSRSNIDPRDDEIQRLKDEIKNVKQARSTAEQHHETNTMELLCKQSYFVTELQHHYQQLVDCKMPHKHMSLHAYAEALKTDSGLFDSNYVWLMQSQLCQRLHCMGILESQLDMINTHCEEEHGDAQEHDNAFKSNKAKTIQMQMDKLEQLEEHIEAARSSLRKTLATQRKVISMLKQPVVVPQEPKVQDNDDQTVRSHTSSTTVSSLTTTSTNRSILSDRFVGVEKLPLAPPADAFAKLKVSSSTDGATSASTSSSQSSRPGMLERSASRVRIELPYQFSFRDRHASVA
eukprot:CAMPEP_0118707932 /NCGR_PEP_ID=MMETSP0800-20121206/21533_1 /TAXON_ID=210618 ORGANISM="Striatella unipunctata, Strain CCMP2910" /NCGR_SAMPLE_ID=MMETSP0800 /ASSEMBLY_ACC=CAM_ASM_000638 /LENGTH=302 /DNA_ID=CAMNT_0006610923 /DNA_START=43 /DNA_END=951 /DNA_ORIENTATION=-